MKKYKLKKKNPEIFTPLRTEHAENGCWDDEIAPFEVDLVFVFGVYWEQRCLTNSGRKFGPAISLLHTLGPKSTFLPPPASGPRAASQDRAGLLDQLIRRVPVGSGDAATSADRSHASTEAEKVSSL